MKIAIIGRSELLYDTAIQLKNFGHEIVCILTAKEAPEYTRKASDFEQLACTLDVPFAQGSKIIEHAELLRSTYADIAVSINYTGVVPQSVINLFPLGILNAHGGDLPRYRGNACQAWAIINGESRIGLCIHKMIGGELDSGDIIARDYFPIDHNTKVTEVWDWMKRRSPELMLSAVSNLSVDPNYLLECQSLDIHDAYRCYPRIPEDGQIDFSNSALSILRLINASNKPYSGAYCQYDGKKLIVWDAELVDDAELFAAVPGQVTKICQDYIEVACGIGKLRISLVEYNDQVKTPSSFIYSVRKRLI